MKLALPSAAAAAAAVCSALLAAASCVALSACGGSDTDAAESKADASSSAEGGAEAGEAFIAGEELRFTSAETGRIHVKLASPAAVVTPGDPQKDKGWDLAFEGLDVFTNSGPSGGGAGSAFGPMDPIGFLNDLAPAVPFMTPDTTGGAFLRWWYYGGPPDHALYTRYHVYGVRDGDRQYKVQVLDYYGMRDGAPVSALYRVRWAEVTAGGIGPVKVLQDLDGSASEQGAKSECLDLGTSARMMLTPAEARASSAWHLCFRRQDISVNGEVGGPRGVTAADLDAEKTPNEKLSDVLSRSAESEQARFDAIDASALAGHTYRGDRVVSAFGTQWLERGASLPTPSKTAWLVLGADGTSRFLVGFARFEGATAKSPGTVVMRVKAVK